MIENMYTSGEYLERHPTWYVEDSPWKAKQIIQMLTQNNMVPETICEVGCGAGEILRQLQALLGSQCTFWGYEISPQAIELCKSRENEKLRFRLADIRQEAEAVFDLILLIDVIEHLEDYFSFLREIKPKSQYKILHIPLDLNLSQIVRGSLINKRKMSGHLHYFTADIALQMLKDVGYEVLDFFYTAEALELPEKAVTSEIKRNLLKLPRKVSFALCGASCTTNIAVRVFGGWSLLVLAR